MTTQLNPFTASSALMKRWLDTSHAVVAGLDPKLVHLIEVRSSQINGCAHCLNMHTKAARAAGETEQRLYLLAAWREAPVFTDRERAALAWTDALTRLSQGDTHTAAYEAVKAHFTEQEQVNLTLMINIINGWNRIAVGFRQFIDPAEAKSAAAKAAA